MTCTLVQSLRLERFRGVRKGAIDGLGQVNVLVGRNNSGKSTILEALLFAAHKSANDQMDVLGRSRLQMITSLRDEGGESPMPQTWWYQRQNAEELRVGLGFAGGDLDVVATRDKLVVTPVTAVGTVFQPYSMTTLFDARLARRDQFEMRAWDDVVATRGDAEICMRLNELFGLTAEGLTFGGKGHLYVTFKSHAVRVDDLGDGSRMSLRLFLLVQLLRGTALLIEELESYQHPGSLRRLCETLVRAVRKRDLQLFVTTHDRDCLTWLLQAAESEGVTGVALHCSLNEGDLRVRTIPAASVLGLDEVGTNVLFLDELHG